MNLRTLRLLEYNKIVEMLTSYAASPMAKRKCERLKPRRDLTLIETPIPYSRHKICPYG